MKDAVKSQKYAGRNDANKKIATPLNNFVSMAQYHTLEKALWDAKQEIKRTKEVESAFLANIRHDMRTPLSGIIGFANLLKGEINDHRLAGYIDNLLLSSHALFNLIDEILETSHLTSNKLPLSEKPFNLRSTLNSLIGKPLV